MIELLCFINLYWHVMLPIANCALIVFNPTRSPEECERSTYVAACLQCEMDEEVGNVN